MAAPNPTLTPALKPPDNVLPNFVDPWSEVDLTRGFSLAFLGLATLMLTARLFTKLYIMRKMHAEDYTLILGWVGYAAFEGLTYAATVDGIGRHQWNVNLSQFSRVLWLQNMSSIVYAPGMVFAKLSVLLQIRRIFTGSEKGFLYWAAVSIIVVNAVAYTAFFLVVIFFCSPREKFWIPTLPGTCVNHSAVLLSSAAFNLVSDVAMLAVPIFAIRRLQTSSRKKMGIFVIFASGILGCVSSALRLYYSNIVLNSEDVTFAYIPIEVTASAEFASIILIACFPVMPRLMKYLRQSGKRTTQQYYSDYPRSGQSKPKSRPTGMEGTGVRTAADGTLQVDPSTPTLKSKSSWIPLSDFADEARLVSRSSDAVEA